MDIAAALFCGVAWKVDHGKIRQPQRNPAEIYLDAIGELLIDYDMLPDWTVGHEREQHP